MRHLLGFGTYDVTTHPRVRVLLDGLEAHGFQVSQLNRPLGIGTAGRISALKNPFALIRFGVRLLRRWVSLAFGSRKFRGANTPDVILVGYMGHFDVLLARLLFPHTPIILDHLIFAADTAKDRGANAGLLQSALRFIDYQALKTASVIVLDTPAHRHLIPAGLTDKTSVIVPVGAPEPWFDAHPAPAPHESEDPLSVVFFGLYTPLQGAPVIARGIRDAASEVPLSVTMIGSGQDAPACRDILAGCQVTWINWVSAEDLPAVVAAHDVCLGIMGTTEKALRVVPNKVYQGMAAGCAVVTSDTQPQREVLGDTAFYCTPGDAQHLADTLIHLSRNRAELAATRQRCAEYASHHFRPAHVVHDLVQVI